MHSIIPLFMLVSCCGLYSYLINILQRVYMVRRVRGLNRAGHGEWLKRYKV
jgi:hypothetical protein